MTGSEPIRLLVCDDNEVVRRALLRALRAKADVEIVGEVGSAEELLARVGEDQPDVVLLDANLPGMSGPEAVEALRSDGTLVPVIVMSADRRNEASAGAAGASGFFYKGSADIPALLEEIRALARP